MTKDETLRLALEYVEELDGCYVEGVRQINDVLITAIKAALEAKDEPVAWMYPDDLKRFETSETFAQAYSIEVVSPTHGKTVPLYTTPLQRTWVGLTCEEVQTLRYKIDSTAHWTYDEFARAIEAKLKDKNNA